MRLVLAGLFSLGLTNPALAGDPSYAAQIADGKPWATTTPDGPSMRLTLFSDGTGRMAVAFMSKSLTWKVEGDSICLAGLPQGKRPGCVKFTPVPGGFSGTGGEGMTLVLRR